MSTRLHYGFGTIETGIVWFRVLIDGARLPAWTSPAVNARTFVIPGSSPPRSETQIVSTGVSTLTWRLAFETTDDLWAMMAKLATTDTLTVLDNVQTHRGAHVEEHGRGYTKLPGTTLLSLDADSPDPDGWTEAVATWQRHINPKTGLLVPNS